MVRKSNIRLQDDAKTPRARRRDRQRDVILRAAARLFRDRGFAETGMRDIADAADLSPANLYHYFDGKHDLLFYCQDRALDRMLEAMASARRRAPSATERLRLVLTAHVRTLLDDIEGATAHLQMESLPPSLRSAIVKKRDRYERALRRLIAEGVRFRRARRPEPGDRRASHARRDELDGHVVPPGGGRHGGGRRRRDVPVPDSWHREPYPGPPTPPVGGQEALVKTRLTCTLNGEPVDVLADDYKTLLEVLREDLQLTGTKHGCELGECGACAVLRRRPARALLPRARRSNPDGRDVTTVEGLAQDGRLHPLQDASPTSAPRSAAIARRAS